jgi:hypothetical protein
MSFANRIVLAIQVTVIGTIIIFGVAFVYYQRDWLVPWKSLGTPPEKAVKIVSAGDGIWVNTDSGKIYQLEYDSFFQCNDETCWRLSEHPESNLDSPWVECDKSSPIFINPVDTQTVCNYWGPGYTVYAYTINSKGTVFTWRETIGEGGWLWAFLYAIIGAPVAFATGLIIAGLKK